MQRRTVPISNVTVNICIEASDMDDVVIVLIDILYITQIIILYTTIYNIQYIHVHLYQPNNNNNLMHRDILYDYTYSWYFFLG